MEKGFWVAKFALFGVLAVTVFGFATMLLWNWLVPVLFGGPYVTFWQALGLLLLTKILFWTVGKGGHHRGGYWRGHDLRRKWNGMTPEERETFKAKMKEKWCHREPNTPTSETGTSNV